MKMDTGWQQGVLGMHLNFPPSVGLIWKQALSGIELS